MLLALQPWTPCLPIRGGKLQTSKTFSMSNPQLPFVCNTTTTASFPGKSAKNNQQNSTNSLNSSYIWREATPNNFNMYSTSVSSLNNNGLRFSLSGTGPNTTSQGVPLDYRALSEERATRKSLNRLKSGFGSGYDNIFMTPLLSRKHKTSPKIVKHSNSTAGQYVTPKQQRPPPQRNQSAEEKQTHEMVHTPPLIGLYDRRLNRSFDAPSQRYAGYGGGYMLGCKGAFKQNTLRRSTPHLAGEELLGTDSDEADCHNSHRSCGLSLLGNGTTDGRQDNIDNQRQSGSWCCGNFVMKQWRKINNY